MASNSVFFKQKVVFEAKLRFFGKNSRKWQQIQFLSEFLCEKRPWHGISKNANFGNKTLKNGMASFDESQHHSQQ